MPAKPAAKPVTKSKKKAARKSSQRPSQKLSQTLSGPQHWQDATKLVHGGTLRSDFLEMSEAIFMTSGYAYRSAEMAEARFTGEDDGFIYSRYGNPTVAMFEERLRLLEGADACLSTASGMAAVTASLLSHLQAGDHVVAARAMFGSCRYVVETLCPRFGIASTIVDGRDPKNWQAAVQENTRAFFFETPSNPLTEIIDIKAVAKIAHKAGAMLIVDNVFATPMLQKPLALGADVVVYSATKHIDGQGRCLGGAVLGSKDFISGDLRTFLRQTGAALSPFNAWVLLKGLETLPLRMHKHCENAARIADWLEARDAVGRVYYPGRKDHPQHALAKKQMTAGGSLVPFTLKGGKARAFRFMNALQIFKITNNLGDAKSLVTHPATTTHQHMGADARAKIGITDDTLRLSIGLEDANDLMADLDQAITASA